MNFSKGTVPTRRYGSPGFRIILIVSNILLGLLFMGTLATVIGIPVRSSLMDTLVRRGASYAADLAGRGRLALAVGDTLRLATDARALLQDEEIERIIYRGADGAIMLRIEGRGSRHAQLPGTESMASSARIKLTASSDGDLFLHEAGADEFRGSRLGSVEVVMNTHRIVIGLVRTTMLVMVLLVSGLILLVRAAMRRFVDPVIRLAEAAQQVRNGVLDIRVAETAPAELGQLEMAFNRMVESLTEQEQSLRAKNDELEDSLRQTESLVEELKQTQDAMVRSEKLRAIGEMASGVAHGFNNVLAAITGRTQLMELKLQKGQLDEEYLRRGLDIVRQAASDGARTVQRLQQYTRGALQKELVGVDLEKLTRQAIDMARPRWSVSDLGRIGTIEVRTSFHCGGLVAADESDLREVILNLLYNAADAMPGGGTLTLATEPRGERTALTITDSGVGMVPEVVRRVFDPFFSTKGVKGNGLGLSIVSGIVKRFGGEVHVTSEPGKGSRFTVLLRPWEERSAIPTAPATDRAPKEASRAVVACLIADDNTTALENLREILESLGHRVTALETGRAAVDALRDGHFDLVITDLGMPEVNGWDVASAARLANGSPPVVLCTGWGDTLDPSDFDSRGVWRSLTKPYTVSQIERILEGLPAAS